MNENTKLIVGCIYRSPNSNEENDDRLYKLMNKANESGATHILIVGDFNYPELNWKDEPVVGANMPYSSSRFLECT